MVPNRDKGTTDDEWRAQLTEAEFRVLRRRGTEPRGGEYDEFYPTRDEGFFACRGCMNPLYSSHPNLARRGWPALDKCYKGASRLRPTHRRAVAIEIKSKVLTPGVRHRR